jgi:predicted PurR-regulated permease PerM
VLGRAAQLHPVVIIFSFFSGAALFGIIGLLLAVPVAAAIKIILGVYYAEPVKGQTPRRRET